jgi:hypothetical protein
MTQKRWTYKELTETAAQQIQKNLSVPAEQRRDWAYGAHLFWWRESDR